MCGVYVCVRDLCGPCWGMRPHKTYMVPPENMVYSQNVIA
jgi:hypothetical protein